MLSQTAALLAYLKEGHSITPLEALNVIGSMRLGARIHDLRKAGHTIRQELITVARTPGGSLVRVARYTLQD